MPFSKTTPAQWAGVSILLILLGGFVVRVYLDSEQAVAENARIATEKTRAAKVREDLIALCAEKGLEAIDLDYPHTPKCLNLETGLMTVPRDIYRARGGRL